MSSNGTPAPPAVPLPPPPTTPYAAVQPSLFLNDGYRSTSLPAKDINSSPLGRNDPFQPKTGAPTWNPAALLQPNRKPASPSVQQPEPRSMPSPVPHRTPSRASAPPNTNGTLAFQFATPNGPASAGPSSGPSTPPDSQPRNALGPGHFVERIHHIQERSEVPNPKRRKVEDEDAPKGTKMAVRGGSGVLGQALKDQRQDSSGTSTPQSLTVDLTDGEISSCLGKAADSNIVYR